MKIRGLLVAFLLGVGLCFIPVLGYGEIEEWLLYETKQSSIDFRLLQARVDYMMANPDDFLQVSFYYDPVGHLGEHFPRLISTKGKIVTSVKDNRGIFAYGSGKSLLDLFKLELELIYLYIKLLATDMDTDVVARFLDKKGTPLGYFYQGEYHLWER